MSIKIETLHCPQRKCDFASTGHRAAQGLSAHLRGNHGLNAENARKQLAVARANARIAAEPDAVEAVNLMPDVGIMLVDIEPAPALPLSGLRSDIAATEHRITELTGMVADRRKLEQELEIKREALQALANTLDHLEKLDQVKGAALTSAAQISG